MNTDFITLNENTLFELQCFLPNLEQMKILFLNFLCFFFGRWSLILTLFFAAHFVCFNNMRLECDTQQKIQRAHTILFVTSVCDDIVFDKKVRST